MLSELITLLKLLNLPVTYNHWVPGQVPKLPYLVVTENEPSDLMADGGHYYKTKNFDVEYYFEKKDPVLEEKIESFFEHEDIGYEPFEDAWIPDDKFYEKIYSINLGE